MLATLDFTAQMQGREHIGEPEAMDITDRVLRRNAQDPLTREGYFELLKMVGRWAAITVFPKSADVWQVELPLRHEFDGFVLTGRLDKLVIVGTHALITDYKTGAYLPTQREVQKRTQLPLYAWHVLQDYPWVRTFECEEVYLRYGVPRPINMDLYNIEQVEQWLSVHVARTARALQLENPEPTPGSHCAYCNAATICPLPKWIRESAIENDEQAREQAKAMLVERAAANRRARGLQSYLGGEDHPTGHVVVGDQRVGYRNKTERRMDKSALGRVVFNVDDFYATVEAPRFDTWPAGSGDNGTKKKSKKKKEGDE